MQEFKRLAELLAAFLKNNNIAAIEVIRGRLSGCGLEACMQKVSFVHQRMRYYLNVVFFIEHFPSI
jgi:hypothetical protein